MSRRLPTRGMSAKEELETERVRPETRRQRLVVRHQGGERDEEERREKRDRGRDEEAVVRDGDEKSLAPDVRRHSPPCERRGDADRAHRVPAAVCTHRRELTTITSVTTNDTASSTTESADA